MFFRTAPVCDFMYGTIDTEVKQRERKKRRVVEKEIHEEEKPEDINLATGGSAKSSFEKQKESMQKALSEAAPKNIVIGRDENDDPIRGQGPVPLFDFIVNPNSFSQTVENIFGLSFLVKDGWAAMGIEKGSGLPYVQPREPKEKSGVGSSVVSLTMADYKRILETFDIEEEDAIIPHRNEAQDTNMLQKGSTASSSSSSSPASSTKKSKTSKRRKRKSR